MTVVHQSFSTLISEFTTCGMKLKVNKRNHKTFNNNIDNKLNSYRAFQWTEGRFTEECGQIK